MLRSLLVMLTGLYGLTTFAPVTQPSDPPIPSQVTTPRVLEFVEYQKLDDIGDTHNMTISPDGTKLVWPDNDQFCVYEIASTTTECVSTGDVTLRGMTGFAWSLDSRYLAFYEDVFLRRYESDLWVFDLETQQLTNLTDDGVQRDFTSDTEIAVNLDYLPVWGPENTLYFFRTLYDHDVEPAPFGLYRISLGNGPENVEEPELVADLTDAMQGEIFAVYSSRSDVLGGVASLSPDGQKMAFLVRPKDSTIDQSIWVVDVATGDLHQAGVLSELAQSGVPVWSQGRLWFNGVAWSGDGQYLVMTTISPDYGASSVQPVYTIHVNTNEAMTLIDFSGIPDEASFFQPSATDQVTGLYDVIRAGVVTPDGDYMVYFNFDERDAGVSGLPLLPPNDSNTPLRLFTFPSDAFAGILPMLHSTAGDDGEYVRVLLLGYMYTFAKR